MPVALNLDLGASTQVVLYRAILLYKDNYNDAFASAHDITGVEQGRPALAPGLLLTTDGLRDLTRTLLKPQPLKLLPPHVLALSTERLVWLEPACKRVLFFQTQDSYLNGLSGTQFPQPALVFSAGERQLKVFAVTSDERPAADTPIYTAPYFNTTSSGVCLGSMPLPESLSPQATRDYSGAFFHSAFTHGTSERLLQGWGHSYGQFVRHEVAFIE